MTAQSGYSLVQHRYSFCGSLKIVTLKWTAPSRAIVSTYFFPLNWLPAAHCKKTHANNDLAQSRGIVGERERRIAVKVKQPTSFWNSTPDTTSQHHPNNLLLEIHHLHPAPARNVKKIIKSFGAVLIGNILLMFDFIMGFIFAYLLKWSWHPFPRLNYYYSVT